MIRLHPVPGYEPPVCPHCATRLSVRGWAMPGMRTLADLWCDACRVRYYGDLPVGHGLYHPVLLNAADCSIHQDHDVEWFGRQLQEAYLSRSTARIGVTVEQFHDVRRPLIVNAIDHMYSHCVQHLLSVQHHLRADAERDVIVLVQPFARWLVPEGVAEVWTVDLPLREGHRWSVDLDRRLHRRLAAFDDAAVSLTFNHPHPADYDLGALTGIDPFPIDQWRRKLAERPTVTWVWREDRTWPQAELPWLRHRHPGRLQRAMGLPGGAVHEQGQRVTAFADTLREALPNLDFEVTGEGERGGLPDWIRDTRTTDYSDRPERYWCQRAAQSHVIVGVHGSHLSLPGWHAGSVVELVPDDRWQLLGTDMMLRDADPMDVIFRHRMVPLETSPATLAHATATLLKHQPDTGMLYRRPFNDHAAMRSDPQAMRRAVARADGGLTRKEAA